MTDTTESKTSALKDQSGGNSTIKRGHNGDRLPAALENRLRQLEILTEELHEAKTEVEAQNEELLAAQQRVETSERKYASLYDLAPVGYFTLNRKGLILEVNRTGAEILSSSKAALIGTPLAFLTADVAHGRFYSHLKKAFESGKRQTCEIAMLPPAGRSAFWVRLQSTVVTDDEGNPLCLTAMSDVTEHKQIEDTRRFVAEANTRLAQSLGYHTTLANIARLCVPFLADWCVIDISEEDGAIERVAVAHYDPAKEELATELRERYPPPSYADHIVSRVIRTGEPDLATKVPDSTLVAAARDKRHLQILRGLGIKSHMIVPLTARDRTIGAVTFASAESGRLYGPNDLALANELASRAALAVDNARLYLRAQQAAEQERRHVERLQGLTRAALLINSALSIKSVVHVITEQARSLIGAHQAMTCVDLRGDAAHAVSAVSFSEKYEQWRHYSVKPDGTGIYSYVRETNRCMRMTQAELEAHPRYTGFGAGAGKHPPMRGWLAAPMTARDGSNIGIIQLSDKYEGEFSEEDEAIAMQLAQMASVAINNAHLFHHAEEAVKLRDEFLSIASHEFRTPLTSLVLQLTALLRSARRGEFGDQKSPRVADRLEGAYGQSMRLTRLVNELLDVSRITAGKLDFEPEEVELSGLVREVVDRFEDELKEAYCTVTLTADKPVTGMWDRFRLDQVVANLLSNAVKYGRGQPVEITIDSDGERAVLSVRDHGIGIKPEHLERIFDRFERGVTTRNYGGLGLGLYIVRSILDAMGGTIRVESSPGQGATFTVELPVGSK